MKKSKRQSAILNTLRLKGTTNLEELSGEFKVSTATIRRDIKDLVNTGQVIQTIGGGILQKKGYAEPESEENVSIAIFEKIKIAEYCSTLVEDQDTVMFGPGFITTLTGRIFGGLKHHFRIVTNSLPLALELSSVENIKTYIIGGDVEGNYSTVMEHNCNGLDSIKYADKLFLTADGIDLEHGLTYFKTTPMIPMIKQMMEIANEVILIAVSSKFEKICFNRLEGIDCIDKIITDDGLDKVIRESFIKHGIEIITV